MGAAHDAHGTRRAVLLVVGVQDEQKLNGARDHRIDLEVLARRPEHQAQEVVDVAEPVLGIEEGLADRVLVRVRRDGRELGDQTIAGYEDLRLVLGIEVFRVEGRDRGDDGGRHGHRVRVLRERVEEPLHVLVEHRVVAQRLEPALVLQLRRQLAVDQQVGNLEEAALLGEILDGVAAIAQDAPFTVDEADLARRTASVLVARIERDQPALGPELSDVDRTFAFRAHQDWKLIGLALELELRRFVHVGSPSPGALSSTSCFTPK